ncbi:hypothetical protein MGLY_35310 (plasmid) [Neomoorella glycerini]|uniref:Uncharacterized protein n=1 Tax=Neomoorella glycerini TaxID=55779 RepID=A0A6I5ZWG0_9FIRM|nr:hypothetical protein [Moorella glycerini]QGP94106.1 hypothetical protein MGLY_35310 [Moorella glycerini]
MLRKIAATMKKASPYVPVILLAFARAAFAASGQPQIVTGAVNLLNDATSWLLGIIPAGSGAAIGYHALMKQMSDGDPATAAHHNRAMRNVLIGGAIGESAVGITKVFLSYFGG